MLGLAGVTAIEATTAAVTVSVVVPLTRRSVAVMVDEPVGQRRGQAGAGDRRDRSVRRAQVTELGEVLRRAVGVGAGRGELLGQALGDATDWPASPRSKSPRRR